MTSNCSDSMRLSLAFSDSSFFNCLVGATSIPPVLLRQRKKVCFVADHRHDFAGRLRSGLG